MTGTASLGASLGLGLLRHHLTAGLWSATGGGYGDDDDDTMDAIAQRIRLGTLRRFLILRVQILFFEAK
jgi:hypothetical protein